jgi:hypothetical protein
MTLITDPVEPLPHDLTTHSESSLDGARPGRQASGIRPPAPEWPLRRSPRRGHRPGRPALPIPAGTADAAGHQPAPVARLSHLDEAGFSNRFVPCKLPGDADGTAIRFAGGYRHDGPVMPDRGRRSAQQPATPTQAGDGASERSPLVALTSTNQRIRLDARHRAERRYLPSRAAVHTAANHPAHQGLTGLGTFRGAPAAIRCEPGVSSFEGRPW